MANPVGRLLDPLRRRVFLMIARGIARAVDSSADVQTWQCGLLSGELRDKMEHFQEYGYTSKPFPGAEGVGVFVGGDRGHGVIIACEDRRYRLKGLADGEVALYTDEGNKIHFKRGGIIAIETSTKVEIIAPETVIDGTLIVTGQITGLATCAITGQITSVAGVVGNGKDLATHTHSGGSPPD